MKKTNNGQTENVKRGFWRPLLHKLIYPASLFYTAITMLFYLCGAVFDLNDRQMVLSRKSGFLLFAFSVIIALANLILTEKKLKLHISLRIVIHYAALLLSFYVLFLNIAEYDAGQSSTIIILAAFSLVYFIVCGTVFAVRGAKKKAAEDAAEYKSIYG